MQYNPPMPVYMITLHAYRSWSEDNPRGYVQRGERGIQSPDPIRAKQRASLAKHPPRSFNNDQQQFILDEAEGVMVNRQVRLHAISCTATHIHMVVSWHGDQVQFKQAHEPFEQVNQLANKVKTILATLLSKRDGTTGNRWFSRGCDCTPIEDREHLNHLLENYLPKHRQEGGMVRILDKGNTSS